MIYYFDTNHKCTKYLKLKTKLKLISIVYGFHFNYNPIRAIYILRILILKK